jgi:hypothetical protein
MKITKNEKLIKRNASIGSWTSMAALIIWGGTTYLMFTRPADSQLLLYTTIAFVVGLILMYIGSYMGMRFGGSPRPDERLDAAFKGLQNEFVMYHYTTPVSHLLVGPAGVWVIKPYHQHGQVTFKKNRWRLSGGGFMQAYARFFGMDGFGRPELDIEGEVQSLTKYLSRKMDESEIPEINAMLVFTNENIELDTENAPMPAMKLKQIKEFMRQKAKEKKLSVETLNQLKTVLE